jgi:hypothetical protein
LVSGSRCLDDVGPPHARASKSRSGRFERSERFASCSRAPAHVSRAVPRLPRVFWLAVARFVLKHAVATTVVWIGCAALTFAAYFVLFVYAMFTNGPLGSPLALPIFVLVAALFGIAVCVCVCIPATVFAEVVRRWRRWWRVWDLPLVVLVLVALVALGVYLNRALAVHPQPDEFWAVIGGILFVLLAVYWCSLQAVDLAFWFAGCVWRAFTWRLDS